MNITLLAAEIADKIPELARDTKVNNEAFITSLIQAEINRCKPIRPNLNDFSQAIGRLCGHNSPEPEPEPVPNWVHWGF